MTEQRTEYTVSGLRIENELLRERNEALRKTVDGFGDASNQHWDSQNRRIKELEAQVARLEADNRRLRKLDAMPLDAVRVVVKDIPASGYHTGNPMNTAVTEVRDWLETLDGDA